MDHKWDTLVNQYILLRKLIKNRFFTSMFSK